MALLLTASQYQSSKLMNFIEQASPTATVLLPVSTTDVYHRQCMCLYEVLIVV